MGELLIFLSDDADSPSDVVLIVVALLAGQSVDEVLLHDLALAGLELLAIKDLGGFSNYWEVFCEDGMSSDI